MLHVCVYILQITCICIGDLQVKCIFFAYVGLHSDKLSVGWKYTKFYKDLIYTINLQWQFSYPSLCVPDPYTNLQVSKII